MEDKIYRDQLAMLSTKMPTGDWGALTFNQKLFKNTYAIVERQVLFAENFEGYNEVLALNDLPAISILILLDTERLLKANISTLKELGDIIGE